MNPRTPPQLSRAALLSHTSPRCLSAASAFPCGLLQPEGSFRFSADALLLAAFLQPATKQTRLVDLGTGCGVAAFAVLLRHAHITAVGIEREPALAQCARVNAAQLGFTERFSCVEGDLAELTPTALFTSPALPAPPLMSAPAPAALRAPKAPFDLAIANPPYYKEGQGREPSSPLRRNALFHTDALPVFCHAASRLLRHKGRFAIIFPASRLVELLESLTAAHLGPRRVLSIFPKASTPASLVLVEARKGVQPDVTIEPPLILHEGTGAQTRFTAAALRFCPELSTVR